MLRVPDLVQDQNAPALAAVNITALNNPVQLWSYIASPFSDIISEQRINAVILAFCFNVEILSKALRLTIVFNFLSFISNAYDFYFYI